MTIVKIQTTTTCVIDWNELSNKLEQHMMELLELDLQENQDDIEARKLALRITADRMSVCETMRSGNWAAVEEQLRSFDIWTSEPFYDAIEIIAGPIFFQVVQ